MVCGVAPNFVHIRQFLNLPHHLFEAVVFADAQPDGAGCSIRQWQAKDAIDVEGPAGEEAQDVRHDAGVIGDGELKDRIHILICRQSVRLRVHARVSI